MPKTKGKKTRRKKLSTSVSKKVRRKSPRKGILHKDRRNREYLTPGEIKRLRHAAAGVGRHGHRDSLVILMMYLHGLRVSEIIDLRWSDLHLKQSTVHVRRIKGSTDSLQAIRGDELRALRKLHRLYPSGSYVFVSERGTPLTGSLLQKMMQRAGEESGLDSELGIIHPHMLRHSTGYALANKGTDTRTIQGYLGHRNIAHTVRYTELSVERFRHILPE